MRNLWLEAFTICLLIVITQVSTEQVVCRNCEGYQICGLKTSQTPDCLNGFPCTKEEYQLCSKITMIREKGKCDRPGVFAESTSPNEFYMCKIKNESLSFEKKTIKCPKNKTFDLSIMKCLSENEKTLLKAAEKLTFTYRKGHIKFYCNKTGTFPDPYDCKMYHVCNSKLESQEFYCPQGAYFNGTNCTTTSSEKCIKQFKKQFQDQVLQAKALFHNVKYLLAKTSPTPRKFKSSASLVSPGVIKRTFYDKNNTKYTYFGIKEGSNSSNYNNSQADLINFEQFVENIIAQVEIEKNSSVILSELKSASKNIIGTFVRNATLVATESGLKLRKSKNKQNKPKNLNRKITLNKVTIIFITQNNCKSCSCQTTVKPFVADNIPNTTVSPEEEFPNDKFSHLESNVKNQIDTSAYSHVKATALDTQHFYGSTNLVPGIKGTNSTQYTYVSKSPSAAQDIYTSSSADFESGVTFILTSANDESNVESSSEMKEIESSNKEFSTKTTSDSEREISVTKDSTSGHPYISTSSEYKDESLGTQDTHVPPKSGTESTIMHTTVSQYSGADSSSQFLETTYADQRLSSSGSLLSGTPSKSNKVTTERYSGTDTWLQAQQVTSYSQAFSVSTESDSKTQSIAMKTSTNHYFDNNAATQLIETAASDLETESTALERITPEYLYTNSYEQETTFPYQEYSFSGGSESEKESDMPKTSSGYVSGIDFSTSADQEFSSSKPPDSETEYNIIRTSASQSFDTNATTQTVEIPNRTNSNVEMESVISKTSTNQFSAANLKPHLSVTSPANQEFSTSKLSNIESETTFMKTSASEYSEQETTFSVSGHPSDSERVTDITKTVSNHHPESYPFLQAEKTTFSHQEFSSSEVGDSEKEATVIEITANQNLETNSYAYADHEFSKSKTSEAEAIRTKTNADQYSDTTHNPTIQSVETTGSMNSDLKIESTTLKMTTLSHQKFSSSELSNSEEEDGLVETSNNEFFYTNSLERGTTVSHENLSSSSVSNLETENAVLNTSPNQLFNWFAITQSVESTGRTNSDLKTESTTLQASMNQISDPDSFYLSKQITSINEGFSKDITSHSQVDSTFMATSTEIHHSDAESTKHFSKSTSTIQGLSSSRPLQSEIPSEFNKTTFPQGEQLSLFGQMLSNGTISNSQITPASIKANTSQFLKTESAADSLKTTLADELFITTTSDSQTASVLMKTNTMNTTPLSTGTISGDQGFSSSEDAESERKSTSVKSSTSQYSDTASFTHSVETTASDKEFFSNGVSESEQDKISAKEPFYGIKEIYSGVEITKATNSISTKNCNETPPQTIEAISKLQMPLSSTVFQSELGTTQLEIKTPEMHLSSGTPYSGLGTSESNVIHSLDSILSPTIEGSTSKSQNADLELESTFKTMSPARNSKGNTYPDLIETTPIIRSTKDSESATVSMSSTITQQPLDIISTVNSNTVTFTSGNNYHSSTLEPEWTTNPALTGPSTNLDINKSDSTKTIHLKQDFFYSKAQEKETGTATITATDATQNSYVGLNSDLQNVTFITQNVPSDVTLPSGTTKINNDQHSDIGTSQSTKLTFIQNFQGSTITQIEGGTNVMIGNSQDTQDSITASTIQYPYSGSTQTSGTETTATKTSTNILSDTLSSSYAQSSNPITEDLQSSKIVESGYQTWNLDTNKSSHSEITTPPTPGIYESSETKSAITGTDFSQHPVINSFYSPETISPDQNLFSSAIIGSETDSSATKITSSQFLNSNQYTYLKETIFKLPTTESEAVYTLAKFSTSQNIDFDISQFSKMTSSNQNAYVDESSQTIETTYNENINNITTERGADKMKSNFTQTFLTSTFPESTAANSVIQSQHMSAILESGTGTITPLIQISINQHTDSNATPQYVQSAPNQKFSSSTVFTSQTETDSIKLSCNSSLPQSSDSTFAIQNLDMSATGETGKEAIPVISSPTQVFQTSSETESTSTSQVYNGNYNEKPGKTTDSYDTSNSIHNTFSTFSQSVETTTDQGQMSNAIIKLEAGTTLSKVNITQHPHVITSPHVTIPATDGHQNNSDLKSETAPPTKKVNYGLHSEKHSSVWPTEITTSGKEYFGSGDSKTGSLLTETSTNKETEFNYSEEGTFPVQEFPTSTALDKSKAVQMGSQFSYKNPLIQSIKTTSGLELYSNSGALYSETGTTLKKTSTNRHPDISVTSDLEDSNFSNQSTNSSESILSKTEKSLVETGAFQFSGTDSFTPFTKTTSADQKLSSSLVSDLEREPAFIKTSTPKYSEMGSTSQSEEIPLLNKELLSSTKSESSSTNHIFYTDSSTEHLKPNSADQVYSISTGSNLEAGFTVTKAITNQFSDSNSFNQFKEVPSESQKFSSSKASNSEPESIVIKTSTSHYLDNIVTTQPVGITNSDEEKESTISKARTDDYFITDSYIQSTGKTSSNEIISSSKDLEHQFESNSAAVVPETMSTVMSIKITQHSDMDSSTQSVKTAFSNAVVPSSTSEQTEREFTSVKYNTSEYTDSVSLVLSEKTSSDVLLSFSAPYYSESVIASEHAYVTKPSELKDTTSVTQDVHNILTEETEVKPASAGFGTVENTDTGSSTPSKEMSSSDPLFSNNSALDPGQESTEYSHIFTSLQPQDTTSTVHNMHDMSTLKSETETFQTKITLNQDPNTDMLAESSGLAHSGNIVLESETEVALIQTNKKPFYSSISRGTQYQNVATTPQETLSYPTSQSEIPSTKVNVSQHSDSDIIKKPTERIPAYNGSSSNAVLDIETGSASVEYGTSENTFLKSTETSSSDDVFFSSAPLNPESEAILIKSSTIGHPYINTSLELKNTSTTINIRSSSALELEPQTTLSKESTSQYSDSDSSTTSTKLISGTETPLIKASISQYSHIDSVVEFIKTNPSDEEVFKSTDSNSEKRPSVTKSSTSKYLDANTSTQDKETTSSNSIFFSSTGPESLFSKASSGLSSDIDFSTDSKQMTLSDEALPSSVALESKKEVTTRRHPYTSESPEMEGTTLSIEDIDTGFTLSGVDITYMGDTTIQFPLTDSFTLHFKTTSADQGASNAMGFESGKETAITKLGNGQIQTGAPSQYVGKTLYTQDMNTFSGLDTETKTAVTKASTNEQPLPKTSSEILNKISTIQDIHSSSNAIPEGETTSTKINVTETSNLKLSHSESDTSTIRNVDINTKVNSEGERTKIEIKTTEAIQEPTPSLGVKDLSPTYDSAILDLDTESSPSRQPVINSFTSSKMTFPNQEFSNVLAPDSKTEKTHMKTNTEQQSAFDSFPQMIKATSSGQEISSSTILKSESGTSLKKTSTFLHSSISVTPEIEITTSTTQNTQNGLFLEAETIYEEASASQYSDINAQQSTTNRDFSTNKASKTNLELEKPGSGGKPPITTPSQSSEMISVDESFSTNTDLNSKAVSTFTKTSTSKFLSISESPHLEYSSFTRENTSRSPVLESEKENNLMKTSTGQYSDTDRFSQSARTNFGDQYTSHSTRQPLLIATSQIPNSHSSNSAETETTANQYHQTNIPLSRTTSEFQDLYSSTLEENYLTTSLSKKSTNLSLNHSLSPKKTTQFQSVNFGMHVKPEILVTPKKTTANSVLVHSSIPLLSGRTTDTGLMTTSSHSYISDSPQPLETASQTQSLYSITGLNSESQTVPTKVSSAEHPGSNTTLHSTKTIITKVNSTKHSDFNQLPYLKEITPPVQNIDSGTSQKLGTSAVSTKYSSTETFYTSTASPSIHDRNTSTILEPVRTIMSETTNNPRTSTIHSINNASGTSDIYSTAVSTSQLTSASFLKKISTSQNDNTSSSFHFQATTSIPEDLDVSMSVKSEITTTLTKTNTTHSPDFSKTTVLKKATSPPQEMKTVSKKTNNIKTILSSKTLQSGMTATTTTTPSLHPYISTFSYSKGTASQTQNIRSNASVESETATSPKKVGSMDYLNFSMIQTQNIDLGPTPQSVTIIPNKISTAQNLKISGSNSSKVESVIFSNTKTNITQHANSNIKKNIFQPEESEKETDFVMATTLRTFYKPFLGKITIPTRVIHEQHSNTSLTLPSTAIIFSVSNPNNKKTFHSLSLGPSTGTLGTLPFATGTPTSATEASLSNTRSNIHTNKSAFHYSDSSLISHSKKTVFSPNQNEMTTLEQKETSWSRGIQKSTTLRPIKNLKSGSKNKSKNNFKNTIKKKRTRTFLCNRVGLFRDPNDCHKYYKCSFNYVKKKNCAFCNSKWWKLVATHKTCENGKWFSTLFGRCVKIRPLLC